MAAPDSKVLCLLQEPNKASQHLCSEQCKASHVLVCVKIKYFHTDSIYLATGLVMLDLKVLWKLPRQLTV